MPTEIYQKNFRDIQENTHHLLSKDIQIFRMKQYTFVTVIRWNEFSEAEVRLEGMLHFRLCIFWNLGTSQPTHWCHVIKDKHSGVSSCNVWIITVCKPSYRRVMFSQVCLILFMGDTSRGEQVPYGIYPPPVERGSQWAGM